MKIKTIDANEACSLTSYIFTDVAGIYPITPSSPMAEYIDTWSSAGMLNAFGSKVSVVEMQSEAGAAGFVHGALQAGALATTYTSSQGLLLMIPNMYKIAGEMLPLTMHVAARSLSTHALSIMGDHQDIYAARQTGFAMLSSSSVADAAYLSAVAHLASIKSSLPFMHFFDGFRTSHEIQKVSILEADELIKLIDQEALSNFRKKALNPMHPVTRGTSQNDDIYFQATEVRNKFYNELPDTVIYYMNEINKLTGSDYKPFNYYGSKTADKIIVAMGSVCETIKETIDYLNNHDYNVGLIEVHLYRPFAVKYLLDVLPKTVKHIAVLDRTKEAGSLGEPLYLDIVGALKNSNINILGGRYGLSSKNTTPSLIKAVYDNLTADGLNSFTIGINDDVTHLSLASDPMFKISDSDEFLIYGYGSDGMVGASKALIKLVGNNTDKYVQGYFQYDSKKSGSVTTCHLRFNDHAIRSTYYVDSPKLVVATKDSYLNAFDMLSNIKEDGIFILNTNQTEQEVLALLNDEVENIIAKRNIQFYIIDGYKLADAVGLKGKISMLMEVLIVYLSKIMDFDLFKDKLKAYVNEEFKNRGIEVVEANYKLIEEAVANLKQVRVSPLLIPSDASKDNDYISLMNQRKGDLIPTSTFLNNPDGTFVAGSTKNEKRAIATSVPSYNPVNCIQCNMCSFVCPHAVIRPFLLDQTEYDNAPDNVKNRCIKPIEKNLEQYYYIIGVSVLDCTGCGLCVKACPGKKGEKALSFKALIDQKINKEHLVSEYLFNHVTDKHIDIPTVKGSQFKTPRFEFSGACSGCGETPYIKLLTQLFGDRMIIANATGCSSIYGASAPSTPYTVPWASSLFEDNAEFGYGILVANNLIKQRLSELMEQHMDNQNSGLFKDWLANPNDFNVTKKVYDDLDKKTLPKEILELIDYIPARSVWTIGGDGWAYDIGFGGIDHVISTGDNINILVLDTQVYSNTGGQASKSSPKGAIAAFANDGKKTNSKDLAKMLMAYPNLYVAQVNMNANPMQLLKALNEAAAYNGPSIVIAYSPCIAHGIDGGLENSIDHEKNATKCGFFPIFRYNPEGKLFTLDSKEVDFNLYEDFLNSQLRFKMLKTINPEKAAILIESNKQAAINKFEYYKQLSEKGQ